MRKTFLQINETSSYYWSGPLSIGLYVTADKKAILIDSGLDESTAKLINKEIKANNWILVAIINTHHHPDHCGGNAYFQKTYPGLKIYATKKERPFIEDKELLTTCLCGGATAFRDLKTKFLEPEESIVTDIVEPYQDCRITIGSSEFLIVTLPGHTRGMIGVITPDGILHCGDAIFGGDTLVKHPVLLYNDMENALKTFEKLASLDVAGCVMYHGGLLTSRDALRETAIKHKDCVNQILEAVESLCKLKPSSLDELTQKMMLQYKIPGTTYSFTLTKSTVQACLAFLEKHKRITIAVVNGLLEAQAAIDHAKETAEPAVAAATPA